MKNLLLLSLALFVSVHALAQAAATPAHVGDKVVMTVTANGTQPFTYIWFKDGKAIANQTASTYTIAAAALTDAGNYTAQVNNSAGSFTSNPAPLAVSVLIVPPTGSSVTITVTPQGS